MIIRVTPKPTVFSKITFPDYSGDMGKGAEYRYDTISKGSNKFIFTVNIYYSLIPENKETIFPVLQSTSEFVVDKDGHVLLIELYQIVRQATCQLATHLFNESAFAPINFKIMPDMNLESLKPDLEVELLLVNRG